ncbi:hypothetical protein PQR33_14835 [Paraburkholderia sediminicola]
MSVGAKVKGDNCGKVVELELTPAEVDTNERGPFVEGGTLLPR